MATTLTEFVRRPGAVLLSALLSILSSTVALTAQATPVARDGRFARVYDLGDPTGDEQGAELSAAGADASADGSADASGRAAGAKSSFSTVMAGLVRAFVQPSLRRGEDVQPLAERWLVVLGRAEQHAWVERFLQVARTQQGTHIEICTELFRMPETVFQADVVPALSPARPDVAAGGSPADRAPSRPIDAAPRVILAPGPGTDAFRAALRQHARIERVTTPTLVVCPHARAQIAITNSIPYVRDFSVEVAQGSMVADPIVDVVQDGFTLEAAATLLPQGAVGIALEATVADLKRPIPTFTTNLGAGQDVSIQLPQVLTSQVTAAAELPRDHLAVFAMPAVAGKRYVVTLTARRIDAAGDSQGKGQGQRQGK